MSCGAFPPSNEAIHTSFSPPGSPPSTCNRNVVYPDREIEPRFCNANTFTAFTLNDPIATPDDAEFNGRGNPTVVEATTFERVLSPMND
jgi:hypothetical protein